MPDNFYTWGTAAAITNPTIQKTMTIVVHANLPLGNKRGGPWKHIFYDIDIYDR